MLRISNKRLVAILAVVLILLLVLIAREIVLYGRFAGLIIGVFLVPLLLIVSIMVGILLGLRRPTGSDVHREKNEEKK